MIQLPITLFSSRVTACRDAMRARSSTSRGMAVPSVRRRAGSARSICICNWVMFCAKVSCALSPKPRGQGRKPTHNLGKADFGDAPSATNRYLHYFQSHLLALPTQNLWLTRERLDQPHHSVPHALNGDVRHNLTSRLFILGQGCGHGQQEVIERFERAQMDRGESSGGGRVHRGIIVGRRE